VEEIRHAYNILVGEHLRDLDIDDRIILEWILEE
jgi:hypothetical protein